jgi:hypothetical protein
MAFLADKRGDCSVLGFVLPSSSEFTGLAGSPLDGPRVATSRAQNLWSALWLRLAYASARTQEMRVQQHYVLIVPSALVHDAELPVSPFAEFLR